MGAAASQKSAKTLNTVLMAVRSSAWLAALGEEDIQVLLEVFVKITIVIGTVDGDDFSFRSARTSIEEPEAPELTVSDRIGKINAGSPFGLNPFGTHTHTCCMTKEYCA